MEGTPRLSLRIGRLRTPIAAARSLAILHDANGATECLATTHQQEQNAQGGRRMLLHTENDRMLFAYAKLLLTNITNLSLSIKTVFN